MGLVQRSLVAMHSPIAQRYNGATVHRVYRASYGLLSSLASVFHLTIGIDDSDSDIDAACHLVIMFASELHHHLGGIDADGALSVAGKATARRVFYDEVIGNIMGPLTSLLQRYPSISNQQRCIRSALILIWHVCMILRSSDLATSLLAGGKRPRRASI